MWRNNDLVCRNRTVDGGDTPYIKLESEDASQEPVALVNSSQEHVDILISLTIMNISFEEARISKIRILYEDRPKELSSLPLATWSLLTERVKKYLDGWLKLKPVQILYLISFVCALIYLAFVAVTGSSNDVPFGVVLTVILMVLVMKHYREKYLKEDFHPLVQSLLEELGPSFTEAGFKVTLMM